MTSILIKVRFMLLAILLLVACKPTATPGPSSALGQALVSTKLPPPVFADIVFSGRVLNQEGDEWLNDRLVLVFVKGMEVGRGITSVGKFPFEGMSYDCTSLYTSDYSYPQLVGTNGTSDGVFNVFITNTYGITSQSLNPFKAKIIYTVGCQFLHKHWLGSEYGIFGIEWVDNLREGATLKLPFPSKKLEYVIRIIDGNYSTLPKELQVAGSAVLNDDGTLVVRIGDTPTGEASTGSDISIDQIAYAVSTETIDLNKISVPIDNCAGSSRLTPKYTQTQTFIREYRTEANIGIGLEIPLTVWLQLVAELEMKYSFLQGQIDTKTIEYEMAAEPKTNIVYTFTWQEIWESGTAKVTQGDTVIEVPFKVRREVVYKVDSKSISCN